MGQPVEASGGGGDVADRPALPRVTRQLNGQRCDKHLITYVSVGAVQQSFG